MDSTLPLIDAPTEYGEVFTRRWVVELILDLCGYTDAIDLTQVTIVDPSVGAGAFVVPIVERLVAARPSGRLWPELRDCVRGWDLQPHHVDTCRRRALEILVAGGCPRGDAEGLVRAWFVAGDFLLDTEPGQRADVVVGNPPYIRIGNLDPAMLAAYRAACPTMAGRSDIVIGFYERGLDMLTDGGELGFICADQWMHNEYGRRLRAKLTGGGFAVDAVIALHDADAFEADVSAYPAITLIRRDEQQEVVVAQAGANFGPDDTEALLDWIDFGEARYDAPTITATRMPTWYDTSASWPAGPPE